MKKNLIFLIGIIVFSHSVYANDYIEKVYESDVPQMTLIGDNYFFPKAKDNVIEYSNDGVNIKKIELDDNISNYTLIYKNGIYLLIDRTQELISSSKLFGGVRNNSPIFFFDENMNLLTRKEYTGYMQYYDFENNFFYLHFRDSSQYKYDENTKSFTGILSDVYYKTENGLDFTELTEDEFYQSKNNKRNEFIICNGKHCYVDGQGTYFLETDNTYNRLIREKSDYNFYGANTTNGVLAYKIKYNEEDEITAQAISYDFLNYYQIPNDANISSAKRDKKYIYLEIIDEHDIETEKMYYRVPIDKINGIKVRYNDSYLAFETPPVIENDFTLVPMRFLFEQMGAEVQWEEKKQTATVKRNDDIISFSIDNTSANVNNTVKTMDVPARLINDKTMIPLRFLSEELGYKVEWDNKTRTAIISN